MAQASCPPHQRCSAHQLPPPRNEQLVRQRLQAEEAAATEAAVRQRETHAIRLDEARNVDAERRSAWLARGQLKEAPPAALMTPLFTLTPSGRVMFGTGKTTEFGASTGLRVDGIALEYGRIAFELEAVVGGRDADGTKAGTVAGEASVVWIGEYTAMPFARLGSSLGRFVSGPATPSGFYRVFLGLGVDNYFIPLGAGRGAGFAFELRAGLFDGYGGGSAALNKVRAELQFILGPRFAF